MTPRSPLKRSQKPIKRSPLKRGSGKWTPPPPEKPLTPRQAIRRKNRSKSEFARIYGSKERVEWVKSLPCAACGVVGYSENAHVPPKGEAGTGYKADYRFIAPLCGIRFGAPTVIGCHGVYDRHRRIFDAAFPNFDPEKAAASTHQAWMEYKNDR